MTEALTRVSIVIPVFRSAGVIRELYTRVRDSVEAMDKDFELILIDDGSDDGTWDEIAGVAGEDGRVKGIVLSRNFGQHPATAAGLDCATGDIIVMMDGDLQDQPEDIPKLVAEVEKGSDIVCGVVGETKLSFASRATSQLFSFILSAVSGTQFPRNVATFRAFNRKILDAIRLHGERNVVFGPLTVSVGFKRSFVPVEKSKRESNGSSYSFLKKFDLALQVLVAYTNLPNKFLIHMGILVFGFSSLYGAVVLIAYLVQGRVLAEGVTIVILLLLGFMGIVMVSIGIIGTYVFHTYREVLRRPRYLVADTLNLPQHIHFDPTFHAGGGSGKMPDSEKSD